MFEEDRFEDLLTDFDLAKITRAYFTLQKIEEANKDRNYGGLPTVTFGKYALLTATAQIGNDKSALARPVLEQAEKNVRQVLSKWEKFQSHLKSLKTNAKYNRQDGFNLDGYYKGSTVAADILAYKWD